jgi:hypothetical protein
MESGDYNTRVRKLEITTPAFVAFHRPRKMRSRAPRGIEPSDIPAAHLMPMISTGE